MVAKRKHRDYQNKLPSVTTVLSLIPSQGLLQWFKSTPYKEIMEKSSKGRLIGSQIHEVIEMSISGEEAKIETEHASEVMNALKSFQLFKAQHKEFQLERAEIAMTSPKHLYNGTIDTMAKKTLSPAEVEIYKCESQLFLGDWKSSNARDYNIPAVYDDHLFQISAYVNLWNENNETQIHKAFILVLAKDKIAYNLREYTSEELDDAFNNYFLPLLGIYKYKKQIKT